MMSSRRRRFLEMGGVAISLQLFIYEVDAVVIARFDGIAGGRWTTGPDHLDGVPRQSSHVMSVINRHSVIGIVDSLPMLELEAVARPRAQGRVPSFQLPDARLRHLVFPRHARRV